MSCFLPEDLPLVAPLHFFFLLRYIVTKSPSCKKLWLISNLFFFFLFPLAVKEETRFFPTLKTQRFIFPEIINKFMCTLLKGEEFRNIFERLPLATVPLASRFRCYVLVPHYYLFLNMCAILLYGCVVVKVLQLR